MPRLLRAVRQRGGHETACVCSEDGSEAHAGRACSTAHFPAQSRVHLMPISSRRQWPPENTRSSRSQPHRNRAHLVVATTSTSASADRPSPAAMKRVCIPRAKYCFAPKQKYSFGFLSSHAVTAVRIRCRRQCQAGKPPQSALRMLPDARRRDASRGSAHGPAKLGGASGPARRVGRRVETRQSQATPALGCISIGLLRVTLASSVSSR